jgi:hypothetical protein
MAGPKGVCGHSVNSVDVRETGKLVAGGFLTLGYG